MFSVSSQPHLLIMDKTIRYFFYVVLNLFFFLATLWVLEYATTFLNGFVVPYRDVGIFHGHQNIMGTLHLLMVLVETALLTLFFYLINRLVLRYGYRTARAGSIANRTAVVNFALTILTFIGSNLFIYFYFHGKF